MGPAVVAAACGHAFAGELDVWGSWYTPAKDTIVEIRDCGDGTPCGIVTWVDPGRGGLLADVQNPDRDLRGRDMVGVTLLGGFERGADCWRAGSIYNPEDGRTYRARLELLSHHKLAVSGCLGPVCKKLVWERADGSAHGTPAGRNDRTPEVASLQGR